jgi:hypothetical protein
MAEKTPKERVSEKFDLAKDIKDSKVQVSIDNIKMVDGKIMATINISGLPVPKGTTDSWSQSNRNIPKIFDTIEDCCDDMTAIFKLSDEDLIKMCKQ